jgi:transcriptional regulator with XRE-family HTH domain
MKRYTYGERDYAFAQLMLTLRTTIGLTQAGLGERLGVSRRAVAEWEGGLSYPKVERLKQLITLGVRASAFASGREEQEIRALWKVAHQKVLLDERWLQNLLATALPVQYFSQTEPLLTSTGSEASAFRRIDLVDALDVSHFVGCEVEVAELSWWIVQEGALPTDRAPWDGRHRQEHAGHLP